MLFFSRNQNINETSTKIDSAVAPPVDYELDGPAWEDAIDDHLVALQAKLTKLIQLTAELNARVIRAETRLCKLMNHLEVSPNKEPCE